MLLAYLAQFLKTQYGRFLLAVTCVSFALSLAHSFYYRIEPAVDADTYDAIAQNIVAGKGFRVDASVPLTEDRAIAKVGPGYQFFLAGVYYVFGHSYAAVWILQAIFHALSVVLIYAISRRVFLERWHPVMGVIAGVLVAFSPDLLIGTSMLLAETLAIFLMLCFILAFLMLLERPGFAYAALAGMLLAVTLLIRTPVGVFLPVALGFLLVGRRFKELVLFFLFFIAVLTPWTVRNWNVYHVVIPANIVWGDDLVAGNNPEASGELDESRYKYAADWTHGPVQGHKESVSTFMGYLASDPLRIAGLTLLRSSMYFSFARPTGWWPYLHDFTKAFIVAASAFYAFALFTLGIAGVLVALRAVARGTRRDMFAVLCFLAVTPLAIIGIIVETRYRYPIYPLFAVFAGYAAWELFVTRSAVAAKFSLIAMAAVTANTAFDVVRNFGRILGRLWS